MVFEKYLTENIENDKEDYKYDYVD